MSKVDTFWGGHTVDDKTYKSIEEHQAYLDWRSSIYPQFKDMMGIYGYHDKDVVLDYGCGPGNDVIGFAYYGNAKKVIGIDVSAKALDLAKLKIALYGFNNIQLIQVQDNVPKIPLADGEVDYIYSQGVIHHTSNPFDILAELYRVLKRKGEFSLMLYNRDSVWYHLYCAYYLKLVKEQSDSIEQICARSTDTGLCPISIAFSPNYVMEMCRSIGFDITFVGGYVGSYESDALSKYYKEALVCPELDEESRIFLKYLKFDKDNFPIINNKSAGFGGVYNLIKG